MPISAPLLLVSILLLISILTSKLSGRFGVPALVIFIGVGIIFGSSGLNWIYLDDYNFAQSLGTIALMYILFTGGLDTRWKKVRPVIWPAISLATLGVLLSAIITGILASYILDLTLLEGMLLGSIIASTDAAAVFLILRSQNVGFKYKLKELMEFESGTNDPMAIFLTIGFIYMITLPDFNFGSMVILFIKQMGIGLLGGFVFGKLIIWIINKVNLDYDGLYPVLLFVLVPLIFASVDLMGGSGFMAMYVSGLTLGNAKFIHRTSVVSFFDGLSWLMQIIVFLTLGLLAFPDQIVKVTLSGILVTAVLIFLARPISVFISLLFNKLRFKAKLMISWTGLRGAVPIIMAIFPFVYGIEKAELIFSVVFFVVVISVLIQGTTIPMVARWLHVDTPVVEKTKFPLHFESSMDTKSALKEIKIEEGDVSIGKKIVDIKLPDEALIVLINRESNFVVPRGTTEIMVHDKLLVLAKKEMIPVLRRLFKENLNILDT